MCLDLEKRSAPLRCPRYVPSLQCVPYVATCCAGPDAPTSPNDVRPLPHLPPFPCSLSTHMQFQLQCQFRELARAPPPPCLWSPARQPCTPLRRNHARYPFFPPPVWTLSAQQPIPHVDSRRISFVHVVGRPSRRTPLVLVLLPDAQLGQRCGKVITLSLCTSELRGWR